MAAAETVKNTVEQYTTASNQAFKDGVEKSLAALAEANTHSKKNLEAVVASVTAATKGAEALGAQTFAYSKKAVEDQVAAAKSLAGAKSVQEAMELQTAWAKSALEAYIAQVSRASEIVSASIKDSVKPLNERAAPPSRSSKPLAKSCYEFRIEGSDRKVRAFFLLRLD
jgi:phasin family protein